MNSALSFHLSLFGTAEVLVTMAQNSPARSTKGWCPVGQLKSALPVIMKSLHNSEAVVASPTGMQYYSRYDVHGKEKSKHITTQSIWVQMTNVGRLSQTVQKPKAEMP